MTALTPRGKSVNARPPRCAPGQMGQRPSARAFPHLRPPASIHGSPLPPPQRHECGRRNQPPPFVASCLRVKHPTIPSHETGPLARCPIRFSWPERRCRACSPPVPLLSPPPRPVAWAISLCAVGAAEACHPLAREIGQRPSARAFPHSRPPASIHGSPLPPPQRHRRCAPKPGVARVSALPRVGAGGSQQPQRGCAGGTNVRIAPHRVGSHIENPSSRCPSSRFRAPANNLPG